MKTQTQLRQAWRSFWVLNRHRSKASWARLLITIASAPTVAVVTVCITYATLQALHRSLERALPAATVKRMSTWRDWRASAVFSAIGVSGTLHPSFPFHEAYVPPTGSLQSLNELKSC
jgi:hypothetical protein